MPGKILVADDDENAVYILRIILEDKGYTVISATNGRDAFRKAVDEKPDLVILDVMMPEMNGYEVCELIKSSPALSSIPVIMVTAKDTGDDVELALQKKADWYVAKPYDNKYLFQKIEKFINKSK
ncbi:MAG: response regulator [Endomicrobiales bacterium]|nr:response regulator [Endomicrobiales bacterium]